MPHDRHDGSMWLIDEDEQPKTMIFAVRGRIGAMLLAGRSTWKICPAGAR